MAFLRIISADYEILNESTIPEVVNVAELTEIIDSVPRSAYGLYWTDKEIERGYDYPFKTPSTKRLEWLKANGLY